MTLLYSPLSSLSAEPDRVQISAGARRPLQGDDTGPPYGAAAWVPAGPWRFPSAKERQALWLPEWPDDGDAVGVLPLPGFEALRLVREQSPRLDLAYARAIDAAALQVLEGARRVCAWQGEPTLTGVAEHPPGLMTLTVEPGTGMRIGLHVDTWEPRPLRERHLAAGRLCVNIGRVERWLLFVPFALREIAGRLERAGIAPAGLSINRLADVFLTAFPSTPVLRVKVRPGEAYIAATDNLIHDGCSLDTARNNLCYTYRGHFGVGRQGRSRRWAVRRYHSSDS